MKSRGILVVHGMGHPIPGFLLHSVVTPVAKWIKELSTKDVSSNISSVEIDNMFGPDRRSFITIKYEGRTWIFTEAYWAPVVAPPQLRRNCSPYFGVMGAAN